MKLLLLTCLLAVAVYAKPSNKRSASHLMAKLDVLQDELVVVKNQLDSMKSAKRSVASSDAEVVRDVMKVVAETKRMKDRMQVVQDQMDEVTAAISNQYSTICDNESYKATLCQTDYGTTNTNLRGTWTADDRCGSTWCDGYGNDGVATAADSEWK